MRRHRVLALGLAAGMGLWGQTRIDLASQGKAVDFSGANSTRPVKTGVSLPPVCLPGEMFFKRDAAPGQNLYFCTANNTWTQMSGGSAGAHAAAHQAGGWDAVGSATPAPNAIPYADANGKLDAWLSVTAVSFDFTASAVWSVPGSTHQLGTCDLAWVARDVAGNAVLPDGFACAPGSFDVTVRWAAPQGGRLSLVKSGGAGGGSGGGPAAWGFIQGNLSDQADLQAALDAKAGVAHGHGAADITAGRLDPARLGDGAPDASKFLRGDGTWSAVAGTAANPAGVPGQVQVNEGGVFGARNAGYGLLLDSLNLALDATVAATLGDEQIFTANKAFTGQVQVTGPGSMLDATGAGRTKPYRQVTADPTGVCEDGEMSVKAGGQRFVCVNGIWAAGVVLNQGAADPTCNATNLGLLFLNVAANPSVLKVCGKNGGGGYGWATITVTGW
jgi:hypothetical protein